LKCRRATGGRHPEGNRRDVLRKLVEQNDPRYAPAAFILAVMLERKRLLKVKEQIVRDGKRISFTSSRRRATSSRLPIRICIWINSKPCSATWRNCWNTA
jgi:hypothetical protein